MREILYRGKMVDNGEWVYGYYCPCCFGRFPCTPAIVPKDKMDMGSWEPKEIIQTTISEFAGVTDKNGTKIFEGDIIRRDCGTNACWNYIVEFDEGEFELHLVGSDGYLWIFKAHDGEVVGNIHDNPELLKKEKV